MPGPRQRLPQRNATAMGADTIQWRDLLRRKHARQPPLRGVGDLATGNGSHLGFVGGMSMARPHAAPVPALVPQDDPNAARRQGQFERSLTATAPAAHNASCGLCPRPQRAAHDDPAIDDPHRCRP